MNVQKICKNRDGGGFNSSKIKKNNLVIRSGSLRMGGLERVLIEVLQNLDVNRYNISLLIEDDSEEKNIFLSDVPEYIDVYFLKSKKIIDKTHYYRERKQNIWYKLIYNILMSNELRLVKRKTIETLKLINKKYGEIDCFIDYDWGARAYVEHLNLKKKIVWIHNSLPKLLKKNSKIIRFGKNLAKYDVVVAICDEMKVEIENLYPYLKGKVERIYNPFNFNRILKMAEDWSKLSENELNLIKKDYIVSVSRLDMVQKDFETLIKGYSDAVKNGVNEFLYIVGGGVDKIKIYNLIKKEKLEDKIKLIGEKTNPYIWIKNSKLFVHSSKYEGLPTVLIEAMICNKVVISSNCPTGPKEILQNGRCGMLFPVGDFKALSFGLQNLLKNNLELEKYKEKLKSRVLDFRSDLVIKEYDKVINKC